MKQAKKIFTRMLMNNWGGVSHKIMEFHEYVNLFSGKSGSGKSTVMDAIQVVLYGSISATFLNKAGGRCEEPPKCAQLPARCAERRLLQS